MKGHRVPWLAGGTIISVVGLAIAARMIAIYNSTPPPPLPEVDRVNLDRVVEASSANAPAAVGNTAATPDVTPAPPGHRHHHRSQAGSPVIASGTCVDVQKERMIPLFLDSLFELNQTSSVRLPSNFHGQELPLMEKFIETDARRTKGMFELQPHRRGQGC